MELTKAKLIFKIKEGQNDFDIKMNFANDKEINETLNALTFMHTAATLDKFNEEYKDIKTPEEFQEKFMKYVEDKIKENILEPLKDAQSHKQNILAFLQKYNGEVGVCMDKNIAFICSKEGIVNDIDDVLKAYYYVMASFILIELFMLEQKKDNKFSSEQVIQTFIQNIYQSTLISLSIIGNIVENIEKSKNEEDKTTDN